MERKKGIGFYKYHGTGNDFVLIGALEGQPLLAPDDVVRLCLRHTGIGADGVIFACPSSTGADALMRIFNADGSEAEMCGNGIRCLAKYLFEIEGIRKEEMSIDTPGGLKTLWLKVREDHTVEEVEVDMGMPELAHPHLPPRETATDKGEVDLPLKDGSIISATCLSMGNPHCVIFVEDVNTAPVGSVGPMLEKHELFPSRANVEFAQISAPDHMFLRVWERGVGETAACGTGACAAFAASVMRGLGNMSMRASLPGGDLRLEIDDHGHIHLAGPAVEVFHGRLSANWKGR